jgi:hypothetical protein
VAYGGCTVHLPLPLIVVVVVVVVVVANSDFALDE